jgi:hypothetical protein
MRVLRLRMMAVKNSMKRRLARAPLVRNDQALIDSARLNLFYCRKL